MLFRSSGQKYGYLDNQILENLRRFNFHPYSYEPFERTLTPLQGKNPKGDNTIFIRDLEEAISRVKLAPKREILRTWI